MIQSITWFAITLSQAGICLTGPKLLVVLRPRVIKW